MLKMLVGAAIGFAAAWFMDSKEGEQRRTAVKEKAAGAAGKGKEQAAGAVAQVKEKAASRKGDSGVAPVAGQSYESATTGEPIAESDEPATVPGPEAFKQG
jgi:gas vesicle protein